MRGVPFFVSSTVVKLLISAPSLLICIVAGCLGVSERRRVSTILLMPIFPGASTQQAGLMSPVSENVFQLHINLLHISFQEEVVSVASRLIV